MSVVVSEFLCLPSAPQALAWSALPCFQKIQKKKQFFFDCFKFYKDIKGFTKGSQLWGQSY